MKKFTMIEKGLAFVLGFIFIASAYGAYQTDSLTLTGLKNKTALATNANGTIIEGSGSSMTYPSSGIAVSNGTAWTTSIATNYFYPATNPNSYIALINLSALNPIQYNNLTGAISWTNSEGYISSVPANTNYEVISFTFKPMSGNILINTTDTKPVAFGGTITKAEIESDTSGSIQFEVYKSSTASPDQRVYSKISASAPMTLTTAYQSSDNTLTGWTKTVVAGDTLQLKCSSATSGNPNDRVQAKIFITRT